VSPLLDLTYASTRPPLGLASASHRPRHASSRPRLGLASNASTCLASAAPRPRLGLTSTSPSTHVGPALPRPRFSIDSAKLGSTSPRFGLVSTRPHFGFASAPSPRLATPWLSLTSPLQASASSRLRLGIDSASLRLRLGPASPSLASPRPHLNSPRLGLASASASNGTSLSLTSA
jgi:hypothetical protein